MYSKANSKANSLRIRYLRSVSFPEFTMNPLFYSKFNLNQLSISWIHYLSIIFFRECSMDLLCSDIILFAISLIVSRHYYEFAMCFMNKRWIHYLIGDFTYWFREFTMRTLFFCQLPLDSSAISRIHHGSIIFFANKLWIHVLFREYTMNALFVPRIHYNFTTFFGNKLCLHYLFREYIKNQDLFREVTINQLSV